MSRSKKPHNFENKIADKLNSLDMKPSAELWNRINGELDDIGPFEAKIAQKLNEPVFEPSKEVWANINQSLPVNNTKRRAGFWFTSSLVVLSLLSAGLIFKFWVEPKSMNEISLDKSTEAVTNEAAVSGVTESTIKFSAKQKQQLTKEPSSTSEEEKMNNSLPPQFIENKSKTKVNENIPPEKSPTVKRTLVQPEKEKRQKRTKTSLFKLSEVNGTINEPTKDITANSGIELANPKPTAPLVNKADKNELKPLTDSSEIKLVQPILLSQTSDSTKPIETVGDNSVYLKPDEELTRFSITAIAGYQVTGMSLYGAEQSGYNLSKAKELRGEMERDASDWTGGFLLNYHLHKHWMLSGGVVINNIKQTLNYQLIAANAAPNHVQNSNAYQHPTDSVVAGTAQVLSNNYSFTEIPLQITYITNPDQRLNAEFSTTISYGFVSSVASYMPDPSCVGLLRVTEKTDFPTFRNTVFLSAGAGLAYKLNGTVQIGSQLFAKRAMLNMVNDPKWIGQIPYSYGFQLFLRKRF